MTPDQRDDADNEFIRDFGGCLKGMGWVALFLFIAYVLNGLFVHN